MGLLQHNNLGSVLEDNGQVMAAIISFRKATKINPGLAIAHYNLGVVLEAEGNLEAATEAYKAAIKIKPHDAKALNNLGVFYKAAEQYEAAKVLLYYGPTVLRSYCTLYYQLVLYHCTSVLS